MEELATGRQPASSYLLKQTKSLWAVWPMLFLSFKNNRLFSYVISSSALGIVLSSSEFVMGIDSSLSDSQGKSPHQRLIADTNIKLKSYFS